ncbi:MAG: biotin carboxylase N-terminal domain-containing protein, partial [Myxococcales bacterium]
MNRATSTGLGRVALVGGGEDAPRVLRSLRALARAGQATVSVALHRPHDRRARFVREADEALEVEGSIEDALRAARADSAWLGEASLAGRADFADACARAGVTHIGPPAEVLRRLSTEGGLLQLAAQLGVPAARLDPADGRARLVEVVIARDRSGSARALGAGDASLRRGELSVLVESPPPGLTPAEEGLARELATNACSAAEWIGVCAVQLLFDPRTRRLALLGLDTCARSALAIEALADVDLVRLALL